jgi:diguanylate cyclase (GGDEF)-like protein
VPSADRHVSLVFRGIYPLVRGLVPAQVRGNPLLTWRVECLLASAFICVPALSGYAVLYRHLGDAVNGWLCWTAAAAIALAAGLLPALGLRRSRNLLVITLYCLLLALTWRLGGIEAPTVLWFTACPVIATTAGGRRAGVLWTVAAVVAILAVLAGQAAGIYPPVQVIEMRLLGVISTVSFLVLLVVVLLTFEQVSVGAIARMDAALARLHEQAGRDDLTGVFNRRKLVQVAEQRIADARRTAPLALCLLDVDHFKEVNDRYGHGVGDDVLVAFARHVQSQVPAQDCFGRYGGEEFLILAGSAGDVRTYAERIRAHVAAQHYPELLGERTITVSIGVAVHQAGESFAQVVARADRALYAAKHGGRDRVELAAAPAALHAAPV